MTGRKFSYTLFAPSFSELAEVTSPVEELRVIEKRLVYGSYPDVVTHPGDEIDRLREIGRGYLYKDILKYEAIRRPEILDRLTEGTETDFRRQESATAWRSPPRGRRRMCRGACGLWGGSGRAAAGW